MSTVDHSWEQSLLRKAMLALEEHLPVRRTAALRYDTGRAYTACETITRLNSRTFYTATALMPAEKRRAIRALYAFCRVSDDIVDTLEENRREHLDAWRNALREPPTQEHPVLVAWYDIRHRYMIPPLYAEHLLEALEQDLSITRYATFEDLAHYCYGVASTVGLMSMHIIGYTSTAAIPYAIKLGVALQLTNILRDIAEDWAQGRLYLPQEELAAFNLKEDDIAAGRVDERWRAFMRYQIARAHRLYAESLPGIAFLHRDGRFAVAAAAELYRAILDDIEAHDYDVFTRRAHISDTRKIRMLPGIAWRAYTNRYAKMIPTT
ncbi:phytoene synthase [Ardenticatena maritima]|uniref:Phytoene synthase n=2 Tax=Ardenticatena maritima TaxID=872965 RepID=A0A0M9UBT1_9CHLR|nr:phytoene/squalene synthase family protein [Ardenticatena maritima]GAP62198.1 phytoene synthase [Ardenticatena maritima]